MAKYTIQLLKLICMCCSFSSFGCSSFRQTSYLPEVDRYVAPSVGSQSQSRVGSDQSKLESVPKNLQLLPMYQFTPVEIDASTNKLFWKIYDDHNHFYSPESLTLLGIGLGVGGGLANSDADKQLQEPFQRAFSENRSSQFLDGFKELGNGYYSLPVFAGSWILGELRPEDPIGQKLGDWGERSSRGVLVGGPPVLGLQLLTGGSRPTETGHDSRWAPIQDNNGVSGHAFMGALPFITAAKMSETPELKALFYSGSLLVPLSRVNDNAHYPSQAALGWWIAYLSASAVNATEDPRSQWRFFPYTDGYSTGIMGEFRY